MINLRDLQTYDPLLKTGEHGYIRAKKVVRYLRMCSKPIVDEKMAAINKSYLYGVQDMAGVKAMFKEPDKSGVNFAQFALMEKVRNVIIAENEDTGINLRLRSTDVMATNEKDRDFELLKNRSWIEPMQTGINKMMGLPPYSMSNDKKMFNGNISDFDKMGMDSNSMEDIDHFYSIHYRLKHEMAGDMALNYCVKYNELNELIPVWINDALTVKCCASRTYVDDCNGAVTYKYLAPENIRGVLGARRDGKDAGCLGYEQEMTISDMISLIGNDFDFNRDLTDLLLAVNTLGKTSITGLLDGKDLVFGTQSNKMMQCSDFLIFRVNVGYIEWKEVNGISHNVWRSTITGRLGIKQVNYTDPVKPNSKYQRDCRYSETTYKAYYLSTGMYECNLYKYGPLNYQVIEGAEDEISNYSIHISREYGKSIVDMAKPYIDIYEKTMKKMEYMIVRAKPPGRMWSFESMLTMGKAMFPGFRPAEQIAKLMEKFAGMPDELYAIPTVNGNPAGGGGAMNFDLPHAMSQSVMQFRELAMWFDSQILDKIGISPLRAAYQPNEKDGLGLQEQSTAYSEKATAYLPRMIQRLVTNVSIRTLSFVQDILQYKDSMAYKWLNTGLGDNTMAELGDLGKVAFHRYNIFVEGLGSASEKREAQMMASQSLQKEEITYEQWLLIREVSSPREAILVLSYEKKRNDRIKDQQVQQAQQAAAQLEDRRHKNKMEEIQLEGDLGNKRENTRGMWLAQGQKISQQGALDKEQAKIDAQPELLKQKQDAEINADISRTVAGESQPMSTQ